jgi:hypothetical protein
MKCELPKSEFPISERKSIDSSGPRESEGPGGSSLLGEGQVASLDNLGLVPLSQLMGGQFRTSTHGARRRAE